MIQRRRSVKAFALALLTLGAALGLAPDPASAVPQTPATAAGQRHALLIGISKYTRKPLQGPSFDVAALDGVLRTRFGFESVRTLVDEQATRQGILNAIDDLKTTTRPGDVIFIYYSGHGTSAMDRRLRLPGLGSFTGAILPSGFRPGTDREMLQQVIIGARDLRPRIEALERDRDVFVIFDTCFSANTARSFQIDGGSTSRSMPWDAITTTRSMDFGDDNTPAQFGKESEIDAGYPYRNTIYLAAAGSGEEAEDISRLRLYQHPTMDGNPHGALTNALLKGLGGAANTNGDGLLTYQELFDYVRTEVTRDFPHTPQLSAPIGRADVLDRPVFNVTRGVGRPSEPAAATTVRPPFRVLARDTELAPGIRTALAALNGVSIVTDGPHDVRVKSMPGGAIAVFHGSGDLLSEYAGAPATVRDLVVTRVARQAQAHQLLNLTFASQDFNVRIAFDAPRGFMVLGESMALRFESDKPGYFLVVNIDPGGYVTVMYPRNPDELRQATGGLNTVARVTEPTGIEFVKLFVFAERPAGFDRWVARQFEADTRDFDDLMTMIRGATGRRAQAVLKVVTTTKAQ